MENEEQAGETSEKWTSWDNPVLTPEQWQEVRRACEAGLSYAEASARWQVDSATIRKRAQRETWITDSRIKRMAEKIAEKESQEVSEQVQSRPVTTGAEVVKRPETALEAFAGSLEGYRSRTLLGLAKLAEKGVERAIDANLNIENWQDAKIAADIAIKLHQVGQEGVHVNICNAFADMDEGKLVETEAEIMDDEGSRDSYFIDAE
jgi:hypothetical protein